MSSMFNDDWVAARAASSAAERLALDAEDGMSLSVCLAMDVRFLYEASGRKEPAGGGCLSVSLLNAKPAVWGIGAEQQSEVMNYVSSVCKDEARQPACVSCIKDILDTPGAAWSKAYGCGEAICQNEKYLAPNNAAVAAHQAQCAGCLASGIGKAWGCEVCLDYIPETEPGKRAACFACVKADPLAGFFDDYYYACAMCANFTTDEAHAACQACIDDAHSSANILFLGNNVTFGQCVEVARNAEAKALKIVMAGGLFTMCFDQFDRNNATIYANNAAAAAVAGTALPAELQAAQDASQWAQDLEACNDCVETLSVDDVTRTYAYGCATYCMNPTLVLSEDDGNNCRECIQASKARDDPWACDNCLRVSTSPDEPKRTALRKACFDCVQADPYQNNNFSNYKWACSECTKIENSVLSNYCLQCIKNETFQIFDMSNIGECIDVTSSVGVMVGGGSLNALERMCFSNWTVDILFNSEGDPDPHGSIDLQVLYMYDKNRTWLEEHLYGANGEPGAPGTPTNGDGVNKLGFEYSDLHVYGGVMPTNGSQCYDCMQDVNANFDLAADQDRRYGCRQYCMDPTMVINEAQATQCIDCLKNPNVKDPWACHNCLGISSSNLLNYTGKFENYVDEYVITPTIDTAMRGNCLACVEPNMLACCKCNVEGMVVNAAGTACECDKDFYLDSDECTGCPDTTTSEAAGSLSLFDCSCPIQGRVRNTEVPYTCECLKDFYLDSDECTGCADTTTSEAAGSLSLFDCSCPIQGMVRNTEVPYTCECPKDFYLDSDECTGCPDTTTTEATGSLSLFDCSCPIQGMVRNTEVPYTCECPKDFYLDSDECTGCPDTTTSEAAGSLSLFDCSCPIQGMVCNTEVPYTCEYPKDFYLDSDECTGCPDTTTSEAAGSLSLFDCSCPIEGRVRNTEVPYMCECPKDFYLDSDECTGCPDTTTSEAAGSLSLFDCSCPIEGRVRNTEVPYMCECPKDFYLDSDECTGCPDTTTTEATGSLSLFDCSCPIQGMVRNTEVPYTCECPKDFYLDSDECTGCPDTTMTEATGSVSLFDCSCPIQGMVRNTEVPYTCECPKDFYLDSDECTGCPDTTTSEAAGSLSLFDCSCPIQGMVRNTEVPYTCECPKDFYLDSDDCTGCPDTTTSEAAGSLSLFDCSCPIQGMVRNTEVPYTCECPKDFYLDSDECTGCPDTTTSEAAGSLSLFDCPCPIEGRVRNTEVPYTCECPKGSVYCTSLNACGFPLKLHAVNDNCVGDDVIVLGDVSTCFQTRANVTSSNLLGLCTNTEHTFTTGTCDVTATLFYATQLAVNTAATNVFNKASTGFPDVCFVNGTSCATLCSANLPCLTDLLLSGMESSPDKNGATIPMDGGIAYSCNPIMQTELPYGFANVDEIAPLCCGTDDCSFCPLFAWKWNYTDSSYTTGNYLRMGNVGKCTSNWASCKDCHGNCCADVGLCPTSSCPGNYLAKNSAKANHVGSCGSNNYNFATGFCVKGGENVSVYTSTHGPGACVDGKNNSPKYHAFCDYRAYGDGTGGTRNPLECFTSGNAQHCLGRVACRDGSSGLRTPCHDDIKKYEGVDCFADGNSENWKLCRGGDEEFDCDTDSGNWNRPPCDATINPTCLLPPVVFDFDLLIGINGSYLTYPEQAPTTAPDNRPAGCLKATPNCTECHGNCCADKDTGTCPDIADTDNLCHNPDFAHVNTTDLGTALMACKFLTLIADWEGIDCFTTESSRAVEATATYFICACANTTFGPATGPEKIACGKGGNNYAPVSITPMGVTITEPVCSNCDPLPIIYSSDEYDYITGKESGRIGGASCHDHTDGCGLCLGACCADANEGTCPTNLTGAFLSVCAANGLGAVDIACTGNSAETTGGTDCPATFYDSNAKCTTTTISGNAAGAVWNAPSNTPLGVELADFDAATCTHARLFFKLL
ncbi:hypothetical protein FOA52_013329 [Chlamydomonas sp. UWO 241]|nr:hypothetical protein FOA52_013329 [Chlamydomonas sp. UWO 241]